MGFKRRGAVGAQAIKYEKGGKFMYKINDIVLYRGRATSITGGPFQDLRGENYYQIENDFGQMVAEEDLTLIATHSNPAENWPFAAEFFNGALELLDEKANDIDSPKGDWQSCQNWIEEKRPGYYTDYQLFMKILDNLNEAGRDWFFHGQINKRLFLNAVNYIWMFLFKIDFKLAKDKD